jgi:hypothetical protein
MTERNTFFLKRPRVLKIMHPIAHKSHFTKQFEAIVNSIPIEYDGCIVYGINKKGRKQPLAYTLLNRGVYSEIQLRTINY